MVRLAGLAMLAALLLAGCSFAPAYVPPTVQTPAAFKEGGPMTPASAEPVTTGWWAVYRDPVLAGLEADLGRANNSLA